MSAETEMITIDELKPGMYVAKLDRPWLETPFLFQGFYIESLDDIRELRDHCQHVYVDIDRFDETITEAQSFPAPRRNAAKQKSAEQSRVIDLSQKSATQTPKRKSKPIDGKSIADDDSVRLKRELDEANLVYMQASTVIDEVMKKIDAGIDVDIAMIHHAVDPMIESVMRNQDALAWLARMKRMDDYVFDHSLAASIWLIIFGKYLGFDRNTLQLVSMGGLFMDVGKTKMPKRLLTQKTRLDDKDTALMRKHVEASVEIAQQIRGVDQKVVEMIATHHERYNGTGYPQRLEGNRIPIFGRIAGIVDSYCAMTMNRPYAKAISAYDAMMQFNHLAGVEFQAEMVEQFVQAIGIFPVGTLVELSTGQVGVVIAQNKVRRLRPKIMILLDNNKKPLDRFPTIDLRTQLVDKTNTESLWIVNGLPPGAFGVDPTNYYI